MDMIKRFVRYYKPHKRLFMLDTACSLMVAVCDLFYPMIAKNITNVYVPNKELRLLLVWAGVLLGIYLIKGGTELYNSVLGPYRGRKDTGRYAARHVPPSSEAALLLL